MRPVIIAGLFALSLGTSVASSATIEHQGVILSAHAHLSRQRSPAKRFAPAKLAIRARLRAQGRALEQFQPGPLSQIRILLNHVSFDRAGLPKCPLGALQGATVLQAQARCGNAEIGKGRLTWPIRCSGSACEARIPSDQLVAFNGRRGGVPAIFVQATGYEGRSDFVLVFAVGRAGRATSVLLADASPSNRPAYSIWPADSITGMELTLGRRYRVHGKGRAYLSVSCPKASGEFPLGRVDFGYASGTVLSGGLMTECSE